MESKPGRLVLQIQRAFRARQEVLGDALVPGSRFQRQRRGGMIESLLAGSTLVSPEVEQPNGRRPSILGEKATVGRASVDSIVWRGDAPTESNISPQEGELELGFFSDGPSFA